MTDRPKVYILILNYNCWHDSIECIESLMGSSYKNFQIILLDNNSSDESEIQLLNYFKSNNENSSFVFYSGLENLSLSQNINQHNLSCPVIFFQTQNNLGFAGANNLILNKLTNENAFVWLLNPDMVVEKNTLENLVNTVISDKNKSIWGTITKSFHNKNELLCYGGAQIKPFLGTVRMVKSNTYRRLDYINGNSLFTHLSNFQSQGLLPEEYFLYWEETDWCFSAKKNGVPLQVCSTAIAYDKGATSIGRGYLSDYYYARNSLLFIKKHYNNFYGFSATLFSIIRIITRILRGQKNKAKGIYYGTIDFYKGKIGNSHERK